MGLLLRYMKRNWPFFSMDEEDQQTVRGDCLPDE